MAAQKSAAQKPPEKTYLGLSRGRWLRIAGLSAVAVVFALALGLITKELRAVGYRELLAQMKAVPAWRLGAAAVLTALSYLTLTCYDHFGLIYAEKPLAYRKTAIASFVSYVFSHNLGLALFGGLAFRYRLYSAWDLTAVDIAKVVAFCGMTFWIGLLSLGGLVFTVLPPQTTITALPEWGFRLIGVGFLAAAGAYVIICARRRAPVKIWKWEVTLPSSRQAWTQIGISTVDWLLASSVLYVLLASVVDVPYARFLSIYILASVAGIVSHVPAGLGVIETVFLVTFEGEASAGAILGALLVYRVMYYLIPLAGAMVTVSAFELANASGRVEQFARTTTRWFTSITPRLFSLFVYVSGVVLLVSGATPSVHSRRAWLEHVLPLGLLEASHLLASITGIALLIVARGLQKRLDGAFHLALALLGAGVVLSLVKGVDFEEAAILAAIFLLLLPCRKHFYRKASLLSAPFSAPWIAAIALTLLSVVWLVYFSHKHVEYRDDLWWTFAWRGEAPRSMRAALLAVVAAFGAGLLVLLRAPTLALAATDEEHLPQEARAIVAAAPKTVANLALLGDKRLLMNDAKTAFLMFGIEGRTWVALGDPVGGTTDDKQELIWRFRDLCDQYAGWPVFYQVDADELPLYIEAGMTLQKIGEEAVVDLAAFSLEGSSKKTFRNSLNRYAKDGYTFAVVAVADVLAVMPELRRVSDDWLAKKSVREKGFSLGYFDEAYLKNFPVAVVRAPDARIVAFANIWPTAPKGELSIDLMRYADDAPGGVMDYLFVQLMLWGKEQGFTAFNLGMAPFSGIEGRSLAPFWAKLGAAIYRYGEHFYNFQGVREYKDKFDPRWQPKFIATRGSLALPVILTNIATLISGGIRGALGK